MAVRRATAVAAACLLVATFASAVVTRAHHPFPPSHLRSVLLGAFPGSAGGGRMAALHRLEHQLHRRLDLVRVFDRWGSSFPTTYDQQVLAGGRTMLLSVRARRRDGSVLPWRQVALARPGSVTYATMTRWADRLRATGKPIWFTFNHEPESGINAANGPPVEYVAAWRHLVEVFRQRHATNVKFFWVMVSSSFGVPVQERQAASKWYPGDHYVDMIGADVYNWSSCRGTPSSAWASLGDLLRGVRRFGAQHPTKPIALSEWGSAEQGGDKGAWFDAARRLFQQPDWQQFVALSYFNAFDTAYPRCDFPVTSSPAAFAAFRRIAADPFFNGHGTRVTAYDQRPVG